MNHLKLNDYFPVGHIVKPHGLKGEMIAEIEEEYGEIFQNPDFLLVEVEGGLVPFFATEEGVHFRTPTVFTVTFDDIDSAEKAKQFCGCKICLQKDNGREETIRDEMNDLLGFMVFDTKKGKLGKITRIDDFSGNIVLAVQHRNTEILIPLFEELISEFNEEKKEMLITCPDGLIDMYLK